MSDGYLLDTNAVVAMLRGHTGLKKLDSRTEIVYPCYCFGELYFGAENSHRVTQNLQKYQRFARLYPILTVNEDTSRTYARVRHKLKIKGNPINDNDYWIAAIALQHNLTLLTRDSDFSAVDGLTVVGW